MRRSGLTMALMVQLLPVLALGSSRYARTSGSQPLVKDNTTGLTWQGCEAGRSGASCETGSSVALTWEAALAYCDTLVWAGVAAWRVPRAKELRSIVDNRHYGPAVDDGVFPATTSSYFWTSSSCANDTSLAWIVLFGNGYVYGLGKGYSAHVRCVRGGP